MIKRRFWWYEIFAKSNDTKWWHTKNHHFFNENKELFWNGNVHGGMLNVNGMPHGRLKMIAEMVSSSLFHRELSCTKAMDKRVYKRENIINIDEILIVNSDRNWIFLSSCLLLFVCLSIYLFRMKCTQIHTNISPKHTFSAIS